MVIQLMGARALPVEPDMPHCDLELRQLGIHPAAQRHRP